MPCVICLGPSQMFSVGSVCVCVCVCACGRSHECSCEGYCNPLSSYSLHHVESSPAHYICACMRTLSLFPTLRTPATAHTFTFVCMSVRACTSVRLCKRARTFACRCVITAGSVCTCPPVVSGTCGQCTRTNENPFQSALLLCFIITFPL